MRRRRGFTLLEVLLALALSVVLLSLLTFSINVYMRASDAGRGEVERAQLARVLLRRMADDLRSTLWKNVAEAASTDAATGDSASGDSASATGSGGTGTGGGSQSSSGAGTGGGAGTGTGGGTGANASDSSSDDASTSSPSTSTEVPPVMGLYGEQGYVQVDVSRLPRIEQYASAMAGTGDIVSDVKTVAYYCQNANSAAASSASGLSRREFDRAVTTYASTNGDISAWERELAPIAAEVTAIEFRYFDGTEWLTAWDTEVKKALPAVVEIAIAISDGTANANTSGTGTASTSTLDASAEGQTIYRLMVFLPQSQTPQTSGVSALETMVSSSVSSAAASAAGGQSGASSAGGASTPQGGGSSGRGGGSSGRGGGTGAQGGGGGQGGPGGGGPGGGGQGGQGGDGPPDDDDDGGGP